ncbi:MAG: LppX_LprAFG lipoprotein [Marmoricola sp.]
MTRSLRSPLAAVLALLLGALLTACGGSNTSGGTDPATALATAKKHFDAARSITLDLSTDSKPASGDAVLGAQGVLTHAPAFQGKVAVFLLGTRADVPVVAVGGKLYAKLPLTTTYSVIDPSQYGAPDPATFVDPDHGVSSLLTQLQGVRRTGTARSGSTIVTTYAGTLPGSKVAPLIPSADPQSSYDTTLNLDKQDRLTSLHVTGDFFGGQSVTYDLALSYGGPVTITAP